MLKLCKLLSVFVLSLALAACLYRPNIQQGNVVTSDMLAQVKPGMTTDQVKYLLGTPVLVNTFDSSRWNYVYTFRKGSKAMVKQDVTLEFKNNVLQTVNSTPLVAMPNPNASK